MEYPLSDKYNTPELMAKIMGPNPLKLEEELLTDHHIPKGAFCQKERGAQLFRRDIHAERCSCFNSFNARV